ncbi:hypothetical protein ABU162_22855 [Paenibacillus thiaminolyticus]|uniref:hypothetical protein n=1 Tax=Paenibacillus thiaminolyticus TaxID=49283 RepID=UPI0035A6440C
MGLIWDKQVSPSPALSKSVAGQFGDPFRSAAMRRNEAYCMLTRSFVLKDSKHPKEAYEFIKYMISKDVQEKSIELSGGTPPTNEQAKEKYYNSFEGVDPQVIKNVYAGDSEKIR